MHNLHNLNNLSNLNNLYNIYNLNNLNNLKNLNNQNNLNNLNNLNNEINVTSQVTGYVHTIQDGVNCETQNCIYYWKCNKNKCTDYPRCEYIGLTKRPFRNRLMEHKQYVRSQLLDKPSGSFQPTGPQSVPPFRVSARTCEESRPLCS